MDNTKAKLLLSLVTILLMSCRNNKETVGITDNSTARTIEINPQIGITPKQMELENVSFVKLKGNKSLTLEDISDLVFTDKYIYVLNIYTFSIYDYHGKQLKEIDLRKEISEKTDGITQAKFNYYTNRLELLIDDGKTLLSFDTLGNLKSATDLVCQVFNFHPVSNYYLFHNGFNLCGTQEIQQGFSYRLTLASSTNPNQIEENYLKFNFKGLKNPKAVIGLRNFANVSGNRDSVLMFESFCDTIYRFDNKKLSSKYLIRFSGENLPLSKIITDENVIDKSAEIAKQKMTIISNVMENERYLNVTFHYYSKNINIKLIGYALYNKTNNSLSVQSEGHNLEPTIAGIPFKFNSSTYPSYMDTKGRFVSHVVPSELRNQLQNENINKNLNGPIHRLVEKFGLKDYLNDERPIIMVYNIK